LEEVNGEGHSEMVQRSKGLRIHYPEHGGKDLFVHQRAIQSSGFRTLKEEDKVECDAERGQKKPEELMFDQRKRALSEPMSSKHQVASETIAGSACI